MSLLSKERGLHSMSIGSTGTIRSPTCARGVRGHAPPGKF